MLYYKKGLASMKEKICVYTCITGNYDELHEPIVPDRGIDFYCFTNIKNLKSDTWKIIQIDNDGLDNHRLSRKIKMLGHPIINKKYNISVWTDASIIWEKSVRDFVNKYLKDSSFAAFKHSQRQTIKDEAIACLRLNKDTKENIIRTLSFLESEHFPDNQGLYEMTVFIKRHNDPIVIKTMDLWFKMNQRYSKRDQLTFMYCIWKTGLQINPINLNVWNNQYFTYRLHNSYPPTTQCNVYYGSSTDSKDFNYKAFFTYHYDIVGSRYNLSTIIPNDASIIEIYFASTPGIIIENFSVTNTITDLVFLNRIKYNEINFFLTPYSIAIIQGKFKKGEPFSFSFNLVNLDKTMSIEILETILHDSAKLQTNNAHQLKNIKKLQSQNQALSTKNNYLTKELSKTDKELRKILASKTWKLANKVKKIFPRKKAA